MGFHGATALVALAATGPCLVTAVRTLSAPARRRVRWCAFGLIALAVVVSIPAALAAYSAHSEVSSGIAQAEGALASIGNGGTESGTAQLRVANADFASAASRTDSWWTAGARLVPVVAQQRQAVATASTVARDVTAVAANQAAGIHYSQLRYSDGHFDLARVTALTGPINVVDSQLTGATAQLRTLQSGWLLQPVQSRLGQLDTQVTRAQASASLAAQLVKVAPSLLGGDGVHHYFVAFMTPAESRGLDGLIASYGELTADQGHLTLTRSGDISQLNSLLPPGGGHLTGPPDYLARYGAFVPQDRFQDLSYAPDLPTVSDVIQQLYPQAGGGPIDGVLTLDPYGLASLIALTGPIDVPGLGQLTSANAASELIKDQYATFAPSQQTQVHDYLQDALRIEFDQLTSGSLPGPHALSEALDAAVRQGRIGFWSFDKSDQPVLRRLGLAGAFPATNGHDVLAVTTQNAANNKVDTYLQRSISDAVNYDPANGAVTSKVTITLHNGASALLPSEVIGSFTGSGLPPGTNRTWLTLYSPLGLHEATVGSLQQGVTDVAELGVHTYSEYVDIPPGASVTLTFDLAGVTTPGTGYRLTVRNQPMVLADHDTVRVEPAPGWGVTGPATWLPGDDGTVGHTFRLHGNG